MTVIALEIPAYQKANCSKPEQSSHTNTGLVVECAAIYS